MKSPLFGNFQGLWEGWETGQLHHLPSVVRKGIFYNTLLLSRVYEQKVAAADLEAIKILKGISPVAWRNINLIGNFDFTNSSTPVDIEALAARYQNQDFWRRSMTEAEDEGPSV